MPDLKKAELIEGVVHMSSPVRLEHQGRPHFLIAGWLWNYHLATPGTLGADNATVRLDARNVPQPDAMLFIDPERGGQARIDADDYVANAPELVAEVAASSAAYDLHEKLEVYQRNQVREFIIWRVLDNAIDWFLLRNGVYEPLPPNDNGVLKSDIFPGLWLDARALLTEDFPKFLAVAQQGLASAEHAKFVASLAKVR
jgi:Uma2 family endonuclease